MTDEWQQAQSYTFRNFRLDASKRRLSKDGEVVSLGTKAFEILLCLVRQRHRVVEKDELLRTVWPNVFVSEDNLSQNVWMLRRALGDDSTHPQFIVTIPRQGYQFIAEVSLPSEPDSNGTPHALTEEVSGRESASARAIELQDEDSNRQPATAEAPARTPLLTGRLRWIVLATAVVVALATLGWLAATRTSPSNASTEMLQFTQASPSPNHVLQDGSVSPDGRYLAFTTLDRSSGTRQLWLRRLASSQARAVSGTSNATSPFWSPDSQSVAFFADNKLRQVSATGDTPPRTLASVSPWPVNGSWGANGIILYEDRLRGLFSVSRDGQVSPVPKMSSADVNYRWPHSLPDGRYLFYVPSPDPKTAGTYVASGGTRSPTKILEGGDLAAVYSPSGHLIFVREQALVRQPFDLASLRTSGSAETLRGDVSVSLATLGSPLSVGRNGVIVLGDDGASRHLALFDRSGRLLASIVPKRRLRNPEFSPDQRQLVAESSDEEVPGLWLIDLERGTSIEIVPDGIAGLWSPDGNSIAYGRGPGKSIGIYVTSNKNTEHEVSFALREGNEELPQGAPTDWSRDGKYLTYVRDTQGKTKTWVLPMFGDRTPRPFVQGTSNVMQARISPTGAWLAYSSDESGTWEVYLESFPNPGSRRVVSVAGGAQPRWRGDGAELFYLAPDHALMAVDVPKTREGRLGQPRKLFQVHISEDVAGSRNHYDVSADGERFLIDGSRDSPEGHQLNVLVSSR